MADETTVMQKAEETAGTAAPTATKEPEISELDRIFMEAGQNLPAAKAAEAPLPAETELSDEEKKKVDEIASSIDLSDSAAVMAFGASTQKQMADFSERTLDSVRTKDMGEVGDMMLIGDFKGNHVALGQKTQDGEKLNLFYAPENKNGDQQIAVVYRDMAGGLWYHIMLGNLVQYLVCDLPNFANPEKGHTVEITAGYGSDDETTEVINLLGDWIDIMKRCQWSKVDIQEGEEEMP